MQVYFTIGISASGKSTWAKNFVKDRNNLLARGEAFGKITEINRDNIRKSFLLENGTIASEDEFSWDKWKWKNESKVTDIQKEMIQKAIDAEMDIVISDTNLNFDRLVSMANMFVTKGYTVKFVLFEVSFYEALERDTARKNGVGVSVLREQWNKFIQFKEKASDSTMIMERIYHSEISKVKRHSKSKDKTDVIMFDIDGTLAHMNGRKAYDWSKVGEDSPDELLSELIGMYLCVNSHKVIFLSGRDGVCYQETLDWIKKNVRNVRFSPEGNAELYMRSQNDTRKDWIVKQEIFFEKVDPFYNVLAVFDDRPQVVRMWHDIGLKVWACGDQMIEF